MKQLVVFGLSTSLLIGCQAVPRRAPDEATVAGREPVVETASRVTQNLEVIATPSDMQSGVGGTFTLLFRNRTAAPIVLTFRDGQQADLAIWTQSGQEVWRQSRNAVHTQAETIQTIAPGKTLTIKVHWAGQDSHGAPVKPGAYRAVMTLKAEGFARASAAVEFRVK